MPATIELFGEYSIEATVSDVLKLQALSNDLPRPAEVFIPFLHNECDEDRIAACAAVRDAGLEPVIHLAARRLTSLEELDDLLSQLRHRASVESIFLIAGDIDRTAGPFEDSLSVINTGLIEKHGFRSVGIAGHCDDHPDVADDIIWQAMHDKVAALADRGLNCQIVTQFSFDAARVLSWLGEVRSRGIATPIRVGVPGPAGVRTLFKYAAICGVSASASVVAKYGLSLGKLLGSAGPESFLDELSAGLAPATTGEVGLHFFPFGGFKRFEDWLIHTTRSHLQAA